MLINCKLFNNHKTLQITCLLFAYLFLCWPSSAQSESFDEIKYKAEQGDPKSQYLLGRKFLTGDGVSINLEAGCKWSLLGAENGHGKAQSNLGMCYENGWSGDKDYRKAAYWYNRAAENGVAHGQYHLGLLYEEGKGVGKDLAQAFRYYKQAAENGLALAQYVLGYFYSTGQGTTKDQVAAFHWVKLAAEQGDRLAQNRTGMHYEDGLGVDQDYKKAAFWYRKAANEGLASAQRNLGYLYSRGKGVAQDIPTAKSWYLKAVKQKDPQAQVELGLLLEFQLGGEKDLQEAAYWYEQAALQDYYLGQRMLGVLYEKGKGVPRDYDQAFKWYSKAAEKGDAQAQNNIGWMYEEGKGFNKDYKKALEWYLRSAEQGYALAQTNIGHLYDNGWGVEQDYTTAANWYQKASAQNDAMAQNNLGWLHLKGLGVAQDTEKAIQLFNLAADQDLALAQQNLADLYYWGHGVEQDYDTAFTLFSSAANKGEAVAQRMVGTMYLAGKGVTIDRNQAALWFEKSASQGDEDAKRALEELKRMDKVFLVSNKDGHTATVTDLVFSSDSEVLFSASADKTIRAWNVRSGESFRTYTGEIGSGDEGQYATIALSPDDKILAAGGGFPGSLGTIRLYDVDSGNLSRIFEGHSVYVTDLSFSEDGAYLLSCSHDKSAILWDITSGRIVHRLKHDGYVMYGLIMPDNSAIITSVDGKLYWWDLQTGTLSRTVDAHQGYIRSLTFMPDGNILSSGSDYYLRQWDQVTGEMTGELKGGGTAGDISSPKDSAFLFWSRSDRFGTIPLRENMKSFFLDNGKGASFIDSSIVSPDGEKAAVGYADGRLILVDIAAGKIARELSEPMSNISMVGFSPQGDQLIWQQEGRTYGLQLQDQAGKYFLGSVVKQLKENPDIAPELKEAEGWSIQVDGEKSDYIKVKKDGKTFHTIKPDGGMDQYDVQISKDGKTIMSYSGWKMIRAFDTVTGKWLYKRPFDAANSGISDIAISPDARFLATGESDQTIKLYNMNTGFLALTIFFDGKNEWIAWIPEGHYTGSLGGDRTIAWHLNQGPNKTALKYEARRFANTYFSPETVYRSLNEASGMPAKGQQNTQTSKIQLQELLPPALTLLEPNMTTVEVDSATLRVKGKAESVNGEPITDIWILVNGQRIDRARGIAVKLKDAKKINGGVAEIDMLVTLPAQQNIVALVAANQYSQSEAMMIEVNRVGGIAENLLHKKRESLADLHILAIGVSEYREQGINLNFAHKDAIGIAEVLSGDDTLYQNIHKKVLTNKAATRSDILDALEALIDVVNQDDVAVLFIAGHGLMDKSGQYFFLPHDTDTDNVDTTGIKWDRFNDTLYSLPSKVILMVDTCHSGSITGKVGEGSIATVLREITQAEGGIVILTASTGDEVSMEREEWGHGAFSKAIIEGLQGQADFFGDRRVGIKELDAYVSNRVKELTGGRQHATTEIPRVLPDFELLAL